MVSCTALTSNTPGRAGMITIVAFLIASSTTAERFGGVSMKTHSMPSRLAAAMISPTARIAVRIGGSLVPRNLCHSVSEPCGSPSTNRHGLVDLWTCAARCAARVLLPEPHLREAKTMMFILLALQIDPETKMNQRSDSLKKNLQVIQRKS